MEEEVRRILDVAVSRESRLGLGSWIHQQFAEAGGIELPVGPRSPVRPAPAEDPGGG